VLRLEFSIADAVYQRGLFSVVGAAVGAWWNRPRIPADLPNYLRADVGLQPLDVPSYWYNAPHNSGIPDPLKRPGI